MNTNACPQCGAPLPPDAPSGLCPRCLVGLNFATETVLPEERAAAQPPLAPEELAPHFPQLEIFECLGRGGMGVVYRARQKALGREVALKLLAPEREKDPEFAARFAREAQALAKLDHPHIVTVYDFGQTGRFFYLLMEFVDGVNLRHLLEARKLTPEEAVAIVPPLCDALQFAHERGIVHRDIKPENLLLAKDGRVKIADFGIARMLAGDTAAEEKPAGTPGYMAPEQSGDPRRADSRADIFSLGVVFYEMLTGELPTRDLQPPSSRLRGVKIDVRIDEVVLRALEREPARRYQTAAELREDVETIASGATPADALRARWMRVPVGQRRLANLLLGLLALALTLFYFWPHRTVSSDGLRVDWSYGYRQPWLVETKLYGSASGSSQVVHLESVSMAAGLAAFFLWLGLGAMQGAEKAAPAGAETAQLRVVELRGGRRRFRPGAVLLASVVLQAAAFTGLGLMMALMHLVLGAAPSLPITLAMVFFLPFFVLARAPHASAPSPAPRPRSPFLLPALVFMIVLLPFTLIFIGIGLPVVMRWQAARPPTAQALHVEPEEPTVADIPPTYHTVPPGAWRNLYFHHGDPLPRYRDATGWQITLHGVKIVQRDPIRDDAGDLIAFAYPTDPRKHFEMLAARAEDARNRGKATADGPAFRAWEKSVPEWTTMAVSRASIQHEADLDFESPETTPLTLPPPPPPGAAFVAQSTVQAPRDSRLSITLYRSMNDTDRKPFGERFAFKTPLDSDQGIILRWHGYPPEHPTHANRWIVELVEPRSQRVFFRLVEGFEERVRMTPLTGVPQHPAAVHSLKLPSESVMDSLLRADRPVPPGEPLRVWWEIDAVITLHSARDSEPTPRFQLPSEKPGP